MPLNNLLDKAGKHKNKIIADRRFLHTHPEVAFNTNETLSYVEKSLIEMGYQPKRCGKAGIVCTVGNKNGKVFLLRADMDALPMPEQADVEFASTNGNMHACGHDMHTAMLLETARLLKECENEINGTIKLMFQSAEEVFEGSKDMIDNGVLQNPNVDVALMIHVMSGVPLKSGMVIVCDGGVSAPAGDYFTINVNGKGCHGSMPNTGVDPITASAHIITALQEINARELALNENAVLTIGTINSGSAPNIIPNNVEMAGTLRTFDEDVRSFVKTRMSEIANGIATSFRAKAEVNFTSGCPTLVNDSDLSNCTVKYVKELIGDNNVFTVSQLSKMASSSKLTKTSGSEDFAYISHQVPSIMMSLAAGNIDDGYIYSQHNPKVKFDESVLPVGSAIYAHTAMRWLEEHN
jgi:hippurate hydrolase